MIRHARSRFSLALAVISLPIAMIGPSMFGFLVFAIRLTPLPTPRLLSTVITAISMTTIATAADVEHAATSTTPTLAKNNFGVFPPHPHPVAGWTSGSPT
ncbi:MAG TPA: hypothetical protein VJT11_01185 [Nitrospiraceae bacterium]|nr:hypothetical protein [Nitrospiraceae bacterium]